MDINRYKDRLSYVVFMEKSLDSVKDKKKFIYFIISYVNSKVILNKI